MAKRSITTEKQSRVEEDRALMAQQTRLREAEIRFRAEQEFRNESRGSYNEDRYTGNPSAEANEGEVAPTRHAPSTEGQREKEKSKYAATEVWRAPKGDRFVGGRGTGV